MRTCTISANSGPKLHQNSQNRFKRFFYLVLRGIDPYNPGSFSP